MSKPITKKDVREIVTQIVTQAIQANNIVLMTEIKKEFREEIVVFKDEIMGAIKEMRDEIAILTGYKDDIEDHGVRIEKIEQKVFPAKN